MEAAVRARTAGKRAVRDVAPDALRERIHELLDESAMVPGVLALTTARAVESAGAASIPRDPDGWTGAGNVEERAAGVQLIYEGLGLTRALAGDPPWERDPTHTEGNLDILAADVMVARGFSLLAHTEAADKAVETVQSFGENRTDDQQDRSTPAHALETDVFELAVVAGTTAFEADPSEPLLRYAAKLADSLDGDRPEPPETVPEEVEQAMADAPHPRQFGPTEDPRPSATDP